MAADAGAAPDAPETKDPILSLAGQLPHLSTGDRALLRRLYLTGSSSSRSYQADGVVEKLLYRAGVRATLEEAREVWRLLAHVAALLSGTAAANPHAAKRPVGRALQDAGYSENRLLRLTAARGDALTGQVIRAARVLAQEGKGSVDLWTFFHLAGRDPDKAEEARVRIARDYYAAAVRTAEGNAK